MAGSIRVTTTDTHSMRWFSDGKRRWVEAYLATGSIDKANERVQFKIYPHPELVQMNEKLIYLRQRHLNLFLRAGESSSEKHL